MQHPGVVKACGGVINVPADALGLCKVKSCALDRTDGSSWDAVLCCGDVVIPADPCLISILPPAPLYMWL